MALYMTQFSYTKEATMAMAQNPQDRSVGLEKAIKKLGGELKCIYFCFGDFDGVAIAEVPNHVTELALLMAVMAAGHLKGIKTTQLLTIEETVEAMKIASDMVYKGPET
jgi:uncharacterized protein with GYD domain